MSGSGSKNTKTQSILLASSANLKASCHICLIPMIQQKAKFKFGCSCRARIWLQRRSLIAGDLLPQYQDFLSYYWEHCNDCLLQHCLYDECIQTTTSGCSWSRLAEIFSWTTTPEIKGTQPKGMQIQDVSRAHFHVHPSPSQIVVLLLRLLSQISSSAPSRQLPCQGPPPPLYKQVGATPNWYAVTQSNFLRIL